MTTKIKKILKIFVALILSLLSLLALHDVIYGRGQEPLLGEFAILGVTLLYFLWLRKSKIKISFKFKS